MSRAFVKEPDGDEVATDLPDRPVSSHRNFVTSQGLAQIEREVEQARHQLTKAQAAGDKGAMAIATRDLRYWTSRQASAEPVEPPQGHEVRFGSRVTIEREDGRIQTFQITGEDEADPTKGTLSYIAPLARALTGREAGDEVEFMGETILVQSLT